jgi:dolichyl-phosphate-mannose--protein O-mannosyl transferase
MSRPVASILPPPGWRRDLVIALLLALVAAALRLPRLGFPPEEVFDEVYHAKTAQQYLRGQPPTEWVHPPTAKLLIAIGVWAFGYESWAWRLLPALAGIALAPVFFLLARRVLPNERAALFASFLLLCDGVYLVQSRVAMTNIFAVLFQVTAALFIVRAGAKERLPVLDMAGAGVFLGLALSTRWTSLWAASFLGATWLVLRRTRVLRLRELALGVLTFVTLPAVIYVVSYVPWMRQGHSLSDMVFMQGAIWRYHATLNATHPYFSKWYTWPWLVRPTWYYFTNQGGFVRGMVAIGNPALWWASVPVSLWAIVSGVRARRPELGIAGLACAAAGGASLVFGGALSFLGVALILASLPCLVAAGLGVRDRVLLFTGLGFFALYLPWGISPRTLNYSHYLFEAIPYACLSLGVLLDRLWNGSARGVAVAYVVLVLALFLLFFPFLTAVAVPADWFNRPFLFGVRPWTWFRSWT